MKFPVRLLERLGNPLYTLNDFQAAKQFHVHPAGVPDQSQDGDLGAFRNVNIQILMFQPGNQMGRLLGGGSVFQNCDHLFSAPT